MTIILLIAVLILLLTPFGIGYAISAPRYMGPVTDHFDGKRFINPGNAKAKGFPEVFKWMFNRKREPWIERLNLPYGEKPIERVHDGVRITFVNHSSFLIQTDGLNILTDPVWSKRTSPFEWAGPKRMRPPGIRLEDLPKIDLLLLSHNHWDHLDIRTVRKIYAAHRPRIITSLGISAFLTNNGIPGAIDLDWWQEEKFSSSLTVQSVPAQHFSGRGLLDRDATLWSGFVMKRPKGNIYFVGDTGYNDKTFKEIGARCAPIDIAIVPIGAFKPQWFMSPIHCSPAEAVRIHQEIKAKTSIATHFGTFPLADDGEGEPVDELKKAMKESGVDQSAFLVLEEGKGTDF